MLPAFYPAPARHFRGPGLAVRGSMPLSKVTVFPDPVPERIGLLKTYFPFVRAVCINQVPKRENLYRALFFDFELTNMPIDDFPIFIIGLENRPISNRLFFRVKFSATQFLIPIPFPLHQRQFVRVLI